MGPFGDGTHNVRVAPDAVLSQKYPFVLPPLGFAPGAVESVVDARTMGLHHDRHHAAYVTALNAAIKPQTALHERTLGELLMGLRRWPAEVQVAIRNQGGGHANHALFWKLLSPGAASSREPSGRLAEMIARDYETVDACKAALREAAVSHFGSGWAWLVKTATSRLAVRTLPNQDSPLLEGELPIIGIDVWEHAYYLKYQNRRAEYVDAVLAHLNWETAGDQVV